MKWRPVFYIARDEHKDGRMPAPDAAEVPSRTNLYGLSSLMTSVASKLRRFNKRLQYKAIVLYLREQSDVPPVKLL